MLAVIQLPTSTTVNWTSAPNPPAIIITGAIQLLVVILLLLISVLHLVLLLQLLPAVRRLSVFLMDLYNPMAVPVLR
jgi:hypothetical protein